MRQRHALGLAIVTTFALGSSAGLAETADASAPTNTSSAAQVTLVGSGAKLGRLDGETRDRQPGFEQTAVVHTKNHIVMISMMATQLPNQGPVQCACASYELQADGPPKVVAPIKALTSYPNGNRTCNHPAAAADDNGNIAWMFGSDTNSNRPNTYAGVINEKCEQLAAPTMVSIGNRNSNDGAPVIQHLGGGKFMGTYYSDGNDITGPFPAEGGDYLVGMGFTISQDAVLPTLTRDWIAPILSGGTQIRGTMAVADATHTVVCGATGGNRPPDRIECALVDNAATGILPQAKVVTKNTLYSRSGQGAEAKYFNQPTVVKVADNQFALMAIESNGMGKNTNIKGSNLTHMRVFERNGDSLIVGNELVGAGLHQTHASICTGTYGEQGNTAIGVFSAAPTGIGRAAMAMVRYDGASKSFLYDAKADLWPAAWYGDSGYLANMYGRNPQRQGRDFMNCIGGVENPGYHRPNGYMADVKTLFVGAVHGRIPGDEKNSLFLSLIPGQMDKKSVPGNPVPAGETPTTEPDTSALNNAPKSETGCGCATVGTRSSSSGAAALLGAGLAIGLVVSRRRRNA